jgi:hypothetical protein
MKQAEVSLHPEFLTKGGKKEFAILPYEEFVALQAFVEDMKDVLALQEAKQEARGAPRISLERAKQELGLD